MSYRPSHATGPLSSKRNSFVHLEDANRRDADLDRIGLSPQDFLNLGREGEDEDNDEADEDVEGRGRSGKARRRRSERAGSRSSQRSRTSIKEEVEEEREGEVDDAGVPINTGFGSLDNSTNTARSASGKIKATGENDAQRGRDRRPSGLGLGMEDQAKQTPPSQRLHHHQPHTEPPSPGLRSRAIPYLRQISSRQVTQHPSHSAQHGISPPIGPIEHLRPDLKRGITARSDITVTGASPIVPILSNRLPSRQTSLPTTPPPRSQHQPQPHSISRTSSHLAFPSYGTLSGVPTPRTMSTQIPRTNSYDQARMAFSNSYASIGSASGLGSRRGSQMSSVLQSPGGKSIKRLSLSLRPRRSRVFRGGEGEEEFFAPEPEPLTARLVNGRAGSKTAGLLPGQKGKHKEGLRSRTQLTRSSSMINAAAGEGYNGNGTGNGMLSTSSSFVGLAPKTAAAGSMLVDSLKRSVGDLGLTFGGKRERSTYDRDISGYATPRSRHGFGLDESGTSGDDEEGQIRRGDGYDSPADYTSQVSSYHHQRRTSTGEEVVSTDDEGGVEMSGLETNGVRVWYSSYDTIDWLHDQIKESVRMNKMKNGSKKSWRGWGVRAFDRSVGWLVVSLIGFLTAIIAFLIIRLEAFVFGLKEGLCAPRWLLTERQCPEGGWQEWDDVLSLSRWKLEKETVGFGVYFAVAMTLAVISSLLTVYLTASNRFDKPSLPPTIEMNGSAQTIKPPLPSELDPLVAVPVQSTPPPAPPARILYFAAGSGIPEIKTILSGFVIRGYLGGMTLFVKSLGLALSVGSGMSLGKEGPFVHIASCVGNIVSRLFAKYETNEAKKREVLSAACAAGVSVAFGAPIGGTLFSWEESSTYYPARVMWRSFFCAAVAALSLRAFDPYGNGKIVMLEVDFNRDYHSNYIYLVAVILGIFGGLYGGYWTKANIAWTKNVRAKTWMKAHPVWEVVMISALTTTVAFPSSWNRMGGTEWVASLFADCKTEMSGPLCFPGVSGSHFWPIVSDVMWGLFVRAALACVTFGIKVPAGIFVPSLAAGAAAGRILGLCFQHWLHHHPHIWFLPHMHDVAPGVYAVIGAAASLAGVTRGTVSLVVIIAELTASLDYVVPVAISVLIAKTLADAISPEGIYDLVIHLNGFPFLDAKQEHHFGANSIYDVVNTDLPYLMVDQPHTVRELQAKIIELEAMRHGDGCFPCLRPQRGSNGLAVVGVLAANELRHALLELADEPSATCNLWPRAAQMESSFYAEAAEDPYDLSVFVDQAPTISLNNSPLELVSQLFNKLGTRSVTIVDDHGRFVGIILKKEWLGFLHKLHEG